MTVLQDHTAIVRTRLAGLIIVYKLVLGLIELGGGLALTFFGSQLEARAMFMIYRELSEDPHDVLASLIVRIIPNLFTHHAIFVVSLILLGLTKIAGAIGLFYKKNWGVDLLVCMTAVMAPFQLISILTHPALFDVLYLLAGVLIALYLIRFQPRAWVSRVFQRQ